MKVNLATVLSSSICQVSLDEGYGILYQLATCKASAHPLPSECSTIGVRIDPLFSLEIALWRAFPLSQDDFHYIASASFGKELFKEY